MERRINVLGAINEANNNNFKNDNPLFYTLFSLSKAISEKTSINKTNIYYNLKRWSEEKTTFNPNNNNTKKILDAFFEILNVNKENYIF